jgi:hypothetical protein
MINKEPLYAIGLPRGTSDRRIRVVLLPQYTVIAMNAP